MVSVETERALIVDTGVLVAAADRTDPRHEACAELLEEDDGPLVATVMVMAETAYLLERDLGVDAELAHTAVIDGSLVLEPLTTEDWTRVKELVDQYRDFPLGGTDASLMAIAERFKTARIATLNHRHFGAVRPSHAPGFDLLPHASR